MDGLLLFILIGFGIVAYAMWNINTVNAMRHRENIRDEIIRGLIESEAHERSGSGCGGFFVTVAMIVLFVTILYMIVTAQPM